VPARRLLHDARTESGATARGDDVVEDLRCDDARKPDERLVRECRQREPRSLRQRVRPRQGEDHRFRVDRLDAEPPRRVEWRAVEDADVDPPILERFGLAQWIELEQREADARQVGTRRS
jgi:hypothetical protein